MSAKEIRAIEAAQKSGSSLHTAWLEATYGHDYLSGHIHDLEIELKSAKKSLSSTKRRIKNIEAVAEKVTGKKPNWKKQ